MRLRERLAGVPGVEAASFSQNGIYSGRNYSTHFDADGFYNADQRTHFSTYDHVGPYFFTTAGTHVMAGRDFNERDDAGAPKVAIVTREFARRVFEGRDSVGRNIYVTTAKQTIVAYQITGVVQDIRNDVRRPQPMFYLCQLQTLSQAFSTRFLVRTRLAPSAVIPSLRAAVGAEAPALHVDQIDSAEDLLDRTLATDRLMAALAWGFGVLAIVLASVGIYGLLSYDVTRRTAEIGIRMAVGAEKRDVVWLVMREAALVCGAGIATGSAVALTMARLVESLVFQMKAANPLLQVAAAIVLVAVAVRRGFPRGGQHGWIQWLRCEMSEFRIREREQRSGLKLDQHISTTLLAVVKANRGRSIRRDQVDNRKPLIFCRPDLQR